jgi:hypothetical protein
MTNKQQLTTSHYKKGLPARQAFLFFRKMAAARGHLYAKDLLHI